VTSPPFIHTQILSNGENNKNKQKYASGIFQSHFVAAFWILPRSSREQRQAVRLDLLENSFL
jgi:hypothetical protein